MATATTPQTLHDRIIREPEERALTGLCRTTRYELEKRGEYPKGVMLSARARGHWLSEVRAWLDGRGRRG